MQHPRPPFIRLPVSDDALSHIVTHVGITEHLHSKIITIQAHADSVKLERRIVRVQHCNAIRAILGRLAGIDVFVVD